MYIRWKSYIGMSSSTRIYIYLYINQGMENYVCPIVEMIEIQVEQGYSTSGYDGGMKIPDWETI